MSQEQVYMGYEDVAKYLNIPIGTAYAWVSQGKIPHIRYSKRMVRFDRSEIDAWLGEKRRKPIGFKKD